MERDETGLGLRMGGDRETPIAAIATARVGEKFLRGRHNKRREAGQPTSDSITPGVVQGGVSVPVARRAHLRSRREPNRPTALAGMSGGRRRRRIRRVTAPLAAAAAVLSFAGLFALALAGGVGAHLAPLWPMCIDAGIAVSTVALVVLRPVSATDLRVACISPAAARTAVALRSRTPDAPAPQNAPLPTLPAGIDNGLVARALVDAGETTKTVEQVEQVLAEHARGVVITRIAADTGMHHKTVRSIIAAAVQHQPLAAVG